MSEKNYDFENMLLNADGLWVACSAFSLLNEEDELTDDDEKIYFLEWCDCEGLTYTIRITDTEIKNAKIIDAENGIISVKDMEGQYTTIQILVSKKL